MKKAFITGINGQDGSYLAEYLLDLGYEVHGIVRRNSTSENQSARLKTAYEKGQLTTHYGDLSDQGSLERLLEMIQPDEVYNIAAQSHVRVSFDVPQYTVQTNAIGVLNISFASPSNAVSIILYNTPLINLDVSSCGTLKYIGLPSSVIPTTIGI